MNKSVATPHKKTDASDTTIQKSKSYYKELYDNTNQEWKWKEDVSTSISLTIDIVSRITNVLKISHSLGSNLSNVPSSSNSLADCTVHFGNDQFAPILSYGDLNKGNVMIKWEIYLFCKRSSGKRLTNCFTNLSMVMASKTFSSELRLYHLTLKDVQNSEFKTTAMNSQVQSCNAEDNSHKVVRLGINPMIQPEPEDLPKDNPKLEIAVLRMKKKCMDKGSKERSPPHNLRQKPGQYICCQNHKLIADIENDIMDPVMQCTTLPSHSGFSQQKLVSFVTEIHTLSIDISLLRLIDIE
ncbi:hypothetical protein Tco_0414956 [Tanacetum coccineum]